MATLNQITIEPKETIFRPGVELLRELTANMPNAHCTGFDNYNVHTKVLSRSKKSTYIIDDDP
ncbi:MAG: hypothetical protein HRU16_08660, partial [Planctomycetes bacterium]|nr:hypothetical protein [Planctomycetota bacterium]